jgi:succinate dehydrogenase/fumarate reductase cytochrome b subunit
MDMNMFNLTGFGGFIVLAMDIWALVAITGSSASMARKVLWALLVVLMPILGFFIWLLFGPRARSGRA